MSTSNGSIPKGQIILGWVMSGIILFPFLPSVFMKVAQPGDFLAQWSKGYPPASARPLGIIELLCVVIYFVPKTRFLGAIPMTGYLGGAVATHVRMGEVAAVVPVLVGMLAWGGLFMRDQRLRALLPTVKG